MDNFVYSGSKTREISFPLGGIGTGCLALSGNGRLIDWEIFNKPSKGSHNGFSHFSIKAEHNGNVLDARVMNGDLHPPYSGDMGSPHFQSFGFGPKRSTMAGIPHFKDVEFEGKYPFAKLRFIDEDFPGRVEMTAFNPLIPLNDKDSSIPGAFFEIEVENILDKAVTYTVALSASNPGAQGTCINSFSKYETVKSISLSSSKFDKSDTEYGDLCIATDAQDTSYQEYWYRGRWFDSLGVYWRDFTSSGKFKNRTYTREQNKNNNYPGGTDTGTIAASVSLGAGEKKKVRFIITWSYPNCTNYWRPEKCDCKDGECDSSGSKTWKNYYATVFENSAAAALYSLENWDRLYNDTLKFKNALFSSTIPAEAMDAVSANISILKTPTCLRLEDGSFYGFEGCQCDSGCCEGSCTHVWNYAYALPFLFPRLERSMRDLDYRYNMREDGGMAFRIQLPLGRERSANRPCADGQFGGVIKMYREWKISGDTQWLKSNWEGIKKNIEFAWAQTNEDGWDSDKDGVLEGRQHHTLDMELFGANSWLTGFYLGALKAGAEMAEYLGETDKANEYMELFLKGKEWVDENLFNGEYYHQMVDLKDKALLEKYDNNEGDASKAYWNDEAKEMKYQVGEGSGIDQVLAQWHANLCGLGEIFNREQVKKALKSIYKYNFKKSMRNFYNPCRLYALNGEAGAVICDWPEGKYKPVVPVTYAEETMNGFEYQAAIHMIQEGLLEEGMEMVKALRERYDGEKRNPWNEFECGSNYARSMASYALLNAFSGFEFDMVNGTLGFNPADAKSDKFKCFWSLDSGWGVFESEPGSVKIKVIYGKITLNKIKVPFIDESKIESVVICGMEKGYKYHDGIVELEDASEIQEENSIEIKLKK